MKKSSAILLAAVLLLALLAGCGGTPTTPATEAPATQAPATQAPATQAPATAAPTAAPTAEPTEAPTPEPTSEPTPEPTPEPTLDPNGTRIVTDVIGREVEIPNIVSRVGAMGSATRTISYAGGIEKVVGTSEMEMKGDVGMPFTYAYQDHLKGCTAIASGGSGNTYYDEAIAQLELDLIIINTNNVETCDDLQEKFGVPVLAVYADRFNSPNLTNSILLVGEALDCKEHAETVVAKIQEWNAELNALTKDIPDDQKPTVYLGAVSFSGGHGFCGTFCNYAPLMAINAVNLADSLGEKGGVEISMEQVIEWDPDIIFLNPGNMGLVNDDYEDNPDAIDSLRAVQEGRVYAQVNFNKYSTNMELAIVDAYYAGTIIYPEAFKDIDFAAKADEIFNVMIGMDFLDILEANGLGFGPITIGD